VTAVTSTTLASLVIVAAVAALAPIVSDALRQGRVPAVAFELVLGIVVGPKVLNWAHPDPIIDILSEFGLATLMFLAGYEIEFDRVRGKPLELAVMGWLVSLALGVAAGLALSTTGLTVSSIVVGLALTTTAIGTLLPMLSEAGELNTRFGAFFLAAGALGEFGPIIAIALLLADGDKAGTVTYLLIFFAVTVAVGLIALRPRPLRLSRLLTRTLNTTGQLAVRVSILVIVGLVWVASRLGLDVLLGAFAAGIIVRLFLMGGEHQEAEIVHGKLETIGFGFFIPLFFVVSGMHFDLTALTNSSSAMAKVPLFLALFLVVRGLPVLLYRKVLPAGSRLPFALLSAAALPLVVVITDIGVQTKRMVPATAAALVTAGLISVLVFPLIAFSLRRRSNQRAGLVAGPSPQSWT
jgi:Kef-type K+ transport system membrane component KefB